MISRLKNWGCNVEEALERFVNDEELYCTCFNMFLTDNSFDSLKESVKAGDCKASFEACHKASAETCQQGLCIRQFVN